MKAILKNTWAILDKAEKKSFFALVVPDIIISLADILSLALLLWIIQFYVAPGNQVDISFLPAWLANRDSIWFITLFFLLFGIKNVTAWLITKAWYRFTGRVAVRLSHQSLLNYQRSGFDQFVKTDSSVHIRSIAFQPFEFCQYILSGIPQIINQSILILLTITAIALFNAKLLLLLLLILLPPAIIVFYLTRISLAKVRDRVKTDNEKSMQYLMDALKGYVEGNVYNRNDFFLHRFVDRRRKFAASVFESISIQTMPPRIIEIFAILGLFVLIAIAKMAGNNSAGYLVIIGAFVGAAYKIIPGIVRIINISGQINAYEFSMDGLIQSKQPIKTVSRKTDAIPINSVHLKNIHFRYDRQAVLNNFSLCLEKGDFVGITGESASGKTTVLNILLGLLEPEKGTLYLNGIPVTNKDMPNYWPSISYVKQQPFFIHDTLLRNITLEEEDYDEGRLESAIKGSGTDALINVFPEGLTKIITENGKNISGGQRQRLALARALYNDASLVILDEPFSELDEEAETILVGNLEKLAKKGKIIVLVTHNRKNLSACNKIIPL